MNQWNHSIMIIRFKFTNYKILSRLVCCVVIIVGQTPENRRISHCFCHLNTPHTSPILRHHSAGQPQHAHFQAKLSPQLIDRSERRHLPQPAPLRQSDRPEQSSETGYEPEEIKKEPQLDLFRSGHTPITGRHAGCTFRQNRIHFRRSHRQRVHTSKEC